MTLICEYEEMHVHDLFALLLALETRQDKWQNQRTEAYNTVIKEEIFRQKLIRWEYTISLSNA